MNEQEEAGIRQTTLDLKRLSVESSPVYRTILRMLKKNLKKKKKKTAISCRFSSIVSKLVNAIMASFQGFFL